MKLVVEKWQSVGFGKVQTGEVVFIHASVVLGPEVHMVDTDAGRERPCSYREGCEDRTCGKRRRIGRRHTRFPSK